MLSRFYGYIVLVTLRRNFESQELLEFGTVKCTTEFLLNASQQFVIVRLNTKKTGLPFVNMNYIMEVPFFKHFIGSSKSFA